MMKYIREFNNYKVNEALGIAEATLFYVNVIKSKILEEILDYMDTRPTLDSQEEMEVEIPFTKIRRYINDWTLYIDFPVSEIAVNLKMIKKRPNDVKLKDIDLDHLVQVPFKMGGYASPFARGREKAAARFKDPVKLNTDHSISIHMEIEFEYSANFRMDRHEEKLELKLESVILHELNHVYESYKRKSKGEKEIEYTGTWASIGSNRRRRPKIIFDYWQDNFSDYIYMSEPHEVRAYIQEAKAYVDKLDLFAFQRTSIWKMAKVMQEYDTDKFRKSLDKVVSNYNPEYVGKITDILVKDFIAEYKRLSLEFKEENAISPELLAKMNTDQFFSFWQKKIRKAGTTIVKKMLRLYTYKKDREEELLD